MSRSLNKVLLIGNVGSEPEIRTVASGVKVAKFSLATNRTYNDRSGQRQEKTEWHRLTAWDRLADLIEQYVKKGDRIYVEGSIEYSQTEDENGKPRYWTDIVVREMLMLGGGGAGGGGGDFESSGSRYSGPRSGGAPRGGGGGGAGGGAGPRRTSPAAPPPSPFEDEDDDLPF